MVFVFLILAFRRDWRALLNACMMTVILSLLPLVLSGQSAARSILAWITQVQSVYVGFSSPDPATHYSAHLVYLEVIINRLLNQQSELTRWLTTGTIFAIASAALYPILRFPSGRNTLLLDFALALSLSLIAFYNRRYGLFVLIPAVVVIYLYFRSLSGGREKLVWGSWLVIVISILLMPSSVFLERVSANPALHSYPLVRIGIVYHAWLALSVCVSLIILRWRVSSSPAHPPFSSLVNPA